MGYPKVNLNIGAKTHIPNLKRQKQQIVALNKPAVVSRNGHLNKEQELKALRRILEGNSAGYM